MKFLPGAVRYWNVMKVFPTVLLALIAGFSPVSAADSDASKSLHPDTRSKGWTRLFAADLSDAMFPAGVWKVENGELTASKDQNIWTKRKYRNFTLDLEFKTADGTNSGVIVHCSDRKNWIPNSLEIQIADDYSPKWSKKDRTWQCAAIFGRLAASKSVVKKPGEWNHYTITCKGRTIRVVLNGELVTVMDMDKWTDPKLNPDGSKIPAWLSTPAAKLDTEGYIGLQGKHAGAPIWFRNIRIRELD